jgi:hypothetical protein
MILKDTADQQLGLETCSLLQHIQKSIGFVYYLVLIMDICPSASGIYIMILKASRRNSLTTQRSNSLIGSSA